MTCQVLYDEGEILSGGWSGVKSNIKEKTSKVIDRRQDKQTDDWVKKVGKNKVGHHSQLLSRAD